MPAWARVRTRCQWQTAKWKEAAVVIRQPVRLEKNIFGPCTLNRVMIIRKNK